MTGLPSSPIPPSSQAKELLDHIAEQLGIDVSVFMSHAASRAEATKPSQSETARLILAFSKIADAHGRSRIVELAEAMAARPEKGRGAAPANGGGLR